MSRKRHGLPVRPPVPRPPERRPGLGFWSVAALAVAALLLTIPLLSRLGSGVAGPASSPPDGVVARAPARTVASPPALTLSAATETGPRPAEPFLLSPKTVLPVPREIAPGPAAFGAPVTLSPPYDAEDSMTILTPDWRVRLVGLEGPAGADVCFDASNKLWACGLQGRAALYNAIRQRPVSCRPTGGMAGAIPLAECSVDGKRLDRTVVAAGFARPLDDRPELRRELVEARAGGRGLWNGGWKIRR